MKIEGGTALVTGANRGLGKSFVDALFEAGAGKVYAGARDPSSLDAPRVVPVRLDIASPDDVTAAARACSDVTLLVNNAGIMLSTTMMSTSAADAMRREMDVNVFGLLAMIQVFAPVLKTNGGGGIVNMLSVVSWFTNPGNATYCASKHAALAVSNAARFELHAQGTQVTGVYAGYIATDMAAGIDAPKTDPMTVARAGIAGVRDGVDHVRVDDRAEAVWNAVRNDPDGFDRSVQERWDQERKKA